MAINFYDAILVGRTSVANTLRTEINDAIATGWDPTGGDNQPPGAVPPASDLGKALGRYLDTAIENAWRKFDFLGQNYTPTNLIIDEVALDLWEDHHPSFVVLWAGDAAGLPRGMRYETDEDGEQIIVGTAVWEKDEILHAASGTTRRDLAIEALPDLVTYDENGSETGRVRPTDFYQNHTFMGWAPRRIDLA